MNSIGPHRRRLLAEQGPVRVERCACGHVVLTVGFVSLTLQDHALPLLARVLQEASDADQPDLLELASHHATLPPDELH